MVKHIGLAQTRGKGEAALQHLMKVNKMKRPEADVYVKGSFWTWVMRSRKQWTLDISCLEEYGIDVNKIKK
jgi:hypothetical protein